MNAADVTHGLKILGGGTKMWVGVLVFAVACSAVCLWLNDPKNRQSLRDGLFA
ncbi:MAG: hypothetical protein WCA10_03855 [Terracidiphilus sp.]|jgi:hypothetical protein